MNEFQLLDCGTVMLEGENNTKTIGTVICDDNCPPNRMKINRIIRNNLLLRLGGIVKIHVSGYVIKTGEKINVLPIEDTVQGITGNLLEVYLKPYFNKLSRPVHKGDVFIVSLAMHAVEFEVMEPQRSPYCIVTPDTVINCNGDPVKRGEGDASLNKIGYDDIGGLGKQLAQLKEVVELTLIRPQLLQTIDVKLLRGILLYEPPGTGMIKTNRVFFRKSKDIYFR
jgi:transitional endoplasmic reticulum ATPase